MRRIIPGSILTASLILIAFLAANCPLHAKGSDRPIVYSARYYLPPGSRGTSHFHIYRINPDGSRRTQLTFGGSEDFDPAWSPDGKWIAYWTLNADGTSSKVNVIRPSGNWTRRLLSVRGRWPFLNVSWAGNSRSLVVTGDLGEAQTDIIDAQSGSILESLRKVQTVIYSPNGRGRILQPDESNKRPTVVQTWSGVRWRTQFQSLDVSAACWADDRTVILAKEDTDPAFTRIDLVAGRSTSYKTILTSETKEFFNSRQRFSFGDQPWPTQLATYPADPQYVLAALNEHLSSGDASGFMLLSTSTNTPSQPLADDLQFVGFSPDGKRFVCAPRQYITVHSHWRHGQERDVWFAPLFIGVTGSHKMRQISPRLSMIDSADWRK